MRFLDVRADVLKEAGSRDQIHEQTITTEAPVLALEFFQPIDQAQISDLLFRYGLKTRSHGSSDGLSRGVPRFEIKIEFGAELFGGVFVVEGYVEEGH